MSFPMPSEKCKPAAWLALLLFLAYALAPEVTQTLGWLRAPSASFDLPTLLCSAQGPVTAPGGKHPARRSGPASCPFCALQAHQPSLASPVVALTALAPGRLPWERGTDYISPLLEWVWLPAQSRAPPPSLG
jgi:hypothetical protein